MFSHLWLSAFGQHSPTFRATSSSQHLWPLASGVFCCWPDGLELPPSGSEFQNVPQTLSNSRW